MDLKGAPGWGGMGSDWARAGMGEGWRVEKETRAEFRGQSKDFGFCTKCNWKPLKGF